MLQKKIFKKVLTFSVFYSHLLLSQSNVRIGASTKVRYYNNIERPVAILQENSGAYLVNEGASLEMTSSSYHPFVDLKHFDKDNNMDRSKEEDKTWLNDRDQILFYRRIGGNIYFFIVSFLGKGESGLKCCRFDPVSETLDNGVTLAVINIPDHPNPFSMDFQSAGFLFRFSPDSEKFLIGNPSLVDEKAVYEEHLFDKDMNLLWEKTISPEFARPGIDCCHDMKIDNAGNVYSIEYEYTGDYQRMALPRTTYKMHYTAVTENGKNIFSRSITAKDKQITECRLLLTKDGQPLLAGLYSDEGTTGINGTFFEAIDQKSGATISQNMQNLPAAFLEPLKNAGDKKDKLETPIDYLSLDENGDIVMVAQAIYKQKYSPGGITEGAAPVRSIIHFFGNIIAIRLDNKGNIKFQTQIPRNSTLGGSIDGFRVNLSGENINLIYNDMPKNLNLPKGQAPQAYFKTNQQITIIAKIDVAGNLATTQLFSSPDKKFYVDMPTLLWKDKSMYFLLTDGSEKCSLVSVQID